MSTTSPLFDIPLQRIDGSPSRLADTVAAHMALRLSEKQKVLEIDPDYPQAEVIKNHMPQE